MSRGKKKKLRDKRGVDLVAKRRRWKRKSSAPVYRPNNTTSIRVICIDCGAHGTILESDDFAMVISVGCPQCHSHNISRVPE